MLKKPLRRLKRLRNPLQRIQRRYLRWNSSISGLFAELDELKCRYVVLRWFESLPSVEKSEDLDVLVVNEDLEALRSCLSIGIPERLRRRRLIKLDIRSVYPPPKKVAYYPPHLAKRLLDNAVRHPSGARVPCPEDHFFSLAFHALYHKGIASGLPLNASGEESVVPNKYSKTLTQLAKQLGYDVGINLEDLDAFLGANGWRPSLDYIEKTSLKDAWLENLIASEHAKLPAKPGLAAFVIRDVALTTDDAPKQISSYLECEGFKVLATKILSAGERECLKSELRGGDWGRGPYHRSGGSPAVLIIAIDAFSRKPVGRLKRKQPHLDNQLVYACKSGIRRCWNMNRPESEQCNIVHSSDHCRQALAYIRLAAPELETRILSEADRLLDKVKLEGDVLRRFQHRGRRSIVELVKLKNGQVVVRKTFRPGQEDYFQREINTINELRKIDPDTVPEIIDCGENYLIMPYYKKRLSQRAKLPIPLPALRKAFFSARRFFDQGYVLADFSPKNVIFCTRNEVKIIDFEKTYHCCNNNFNRQHRFADVINGNISNPLKSQIRVTPNSQKYYEWWGRAAAVPLQSLLNDPAYLVYLKRWTIGYLIYARALFSKPVKWNKQSKQNLAKGVFVKRALNQPQSDSLGIAPAHILPKSPQG